ncbi:hypothetical protein LEMLEM_LOCUS8798, partial [Lemmus lemmus]
MVMLCLIVTAWDDTHREKVNVTTPRSRNPTFLLLRSAVKWVHHPEKPGQELKQKPGGSHLFPN